MLRERVASVEVVDEDKAADEVAPVTLASLSAQLATLSEAVEKQQRLLNSLNNAMGQVADEQFQLKSKLKRRVSSSRQSTKGSVVNDGQGGAVHIE